MAYGYGLIDIRGEVDSMRYNQLTLHRKPRFNASGAVSQSTREINTGLRNIHIMKFRGYQEKKYPVSESLEQRKNFRFSRFEVTVSRRAPCVELPPFYSFSLFVIGPSSGRFEILG